MKTFILAKCINLYWTKKSEVIMSRHAISQICAKGIQI